MLGFSGGLIEPLPLLFCPISHSLMRDPVVTSDGHAYERQDIESKHLMFAPMGSVPDLLERFEDEVTLQHTRTFLVQVCSGMEALAESGLIHRDLALRNCLVFRFDPADASASSVKASDFGLTISYYVARTSW